ncbi:MULTISPECIES: 4-hydroxy-tetrahydrodipicolinate reductase [Helicobacter]|uniref:4-hydroxy-tetrahydrodipicolinate reductase n=4 Tax=Helicobacter TaxID=209 RepID=A0A3D8IH92_9HELI|nr:MULTISPECIES: 4-hydroxy-tetrahydrodipicolinate reductase [Helicobacter]RDU64286.1 4-hydroxy-tetrahydrodipicolinate reductase [Helicobacter ganmani]
MLGIGVFGAGGRVGKLVVDLAKKSQEVKLECVYVRKDLDFSIDPGVLITGDLKVLLESSAVVIDFTTAEGTRALLEVALNNPKPIVIGTTGLESHHENLIKEASKKMPILYASNLSLGVAVLNKAVKLVASALKDFDIEIVETHHHHKKDSPSGTALRLAQTCAKARNLELDKVRTSGRNGNIGERHKDEIGVMALRGGDVAGIHNVGFYGEGEYLELIHTATSRATFAQGAIKAALWLQKQPNGLYSIEDSLGL